MLQVPQEGGVESMRQVGELHDLEFPALSLMVTWQFEPSEVTVQLPPATSMPLPPESVEFDSVKVTFVELQALPLGLQVPQVGSVVSAAAKTKECAARANAPIPERSATVMGFRFLAGAEFEVMMLMKAVKRLNCSFSQDRSQGGLSAPKFRKRRRPSRSRAFFRITGSERRRKGRILGRISAIGGVVGGYLGLLKFPVIPLPSDFFFDDLSTELSFWSGPA